VPVLGDQPRVSSAVRGANPFVHQRYRRANHYDPQWIQENQMGPNALWLLESLTEVLHLERGMQVLDLGCGRAMSSIFLAKEFGVSVTAADLWIDPSDNGTRIDEAGVADLVAPVHVEAHALPFPERSFDAVVSIDAYHYFGTADLYLGYVGRFLRPGGRLGIVSPSLSSPVGEVPDELMDFWDWEFCSFHDPWWWRTHFEKTGLVDVEVADAVEDGWADWLRFNEITAPFLDGWRKEAAEREAAMLRVDRGRYLGFARIVAQWR
jgi:SAM-dependent methyltransferase